MVCLPVPAAAQVYVDVGVFAPPVAARVAVGPPPLYVVGPYYRPVYVPVAPAWRPGPPWGHVKRHRYVRDVRQAHRDYVRDLRRAERDYRRDVRQARRDYDRELRRAGWYGW